MITSYHISRSTSKLEIADNEGAIGSCCPEFPIFQYFLSVVPTTYIDSSRRKIQTSQVSVGKR
jgi:hypothetical protein